NFLADGFDPLRPRVDWRGATDGAVECEFPLYQLAIATVMAGLGEAEWPGRLLSLLATLWAAFSLHRLLELRAGPAGALAGLLTFLTCGSTVLIATRVMPDALSQSLAVASLVAYVRFVASGSRVALWTSMAALLFAALQKPLALQVGWIMFGWVALLAPRRLRDPQLWLGFAAVLATVAAWLLHGKALHDETGLTFGVLSGGDTKFPDLEHLLSWKIHAQLGWTTVQHGFSALGLIAAAVLLLRRRLDRCDAVLIGSAVAALYLSLRYSYHQGMGPHYHGYAALAGAWCVARAWPARPPRALWFALLVAVLAQGAWRLSVEADRRRGMVDNPMIEVAAAIRELTRPDERIVVRSAKQRIDPLWNRRNNFEDPSLLYQTRLHGWVVPADGFVPAALRRLRAAGATLVFDWAGPTRSPARDWLEQHAKLLLDRPGARLYRLRTGD
ncbi:MAG: glycosyltransferase family 39 protein, partial [Planctomycetes bacterium]|nr:glycosyltransferase family 39 protein [Planctomycetota bacterium]